MWALWLGGGLVIGVTVATLVPHVAREAGHDERGKLVTARSELVDKPVLAMGEAAVVAGMSVQATRRLVRRWENTVPDLVDKSRPTRWLVRTAALLRVVGDTHAGILERERLIGIVRRHGERLDDHAEVLRGHDRRLTRVEASLRTAHA